MGKINKVIKLRRKRRVSGNISGTKDRPRIVVYRSNKYIYAQAINDDQKRTLAQFSSLNIKKSTSKSSKMDESKSIGKELAARLVKQGVKQAVFDRSIYAYKGKVKALAEGLREGGLTI